MRLRDAKINLSSQSLWYSMHCIIYALERKEGKPLLFKQTLITVAFHTIRSLCVVFGLSTRPEIRLSSQATPKAYIKIFSSQKGLCTFFLLGIEWSDSKTSQTLSISRCKLVSLTIILKKVGRHETWAREISIGGRDFSIPVHYHRRPFSDFFFLREEGGCAQATSSPLPTPSPSRKPSSSTPSLPLSPSPSPSSCALLHSQFSCLLYVHVQLMYYL